MTKRDGDKNFAQKCVGRKAVPFLTAAFAMSLSLGATPAASTTITDHRPAIEEYKRLGVEERLQSLGPDLLGDQIDPNSGTLAFQHVDVSLPGNSGLEVAIRRQRSQGMNYKDVTETAFADWDLLVPNINVVTATDIPWNSQRCSLGFDNHLVEVVRSRSDGLSSFSSTYKRGDYSNGFMLEVPGAGAQQILEGNYNGQASGASHVTKDGWKLTCMTSAPGEGFYAYAPNGDRYTFDEPVTRAYGLLNDRSVGALNLERHKHILFASEVTDVNGNWVRYDYDTSGRLTRIHANDGREITLIYTGASQQVSEVRANGRIWQYSYRRNTHMGRYIADERQQLLGDVLDRVTLPDATYWDFTLDGMSAEPFPGGLCVEPTVTVSVKHPHGIVGDFILTEHRRRQSLQASSEILPCPTTEVVPPPYPVLAPVYETRKADIMAVTEKKLTGPGIALPLIWSFAYEQDSGAGGSSASDQTNWSRMTDPNGDVTIGFYQWNTLATESGKLMRQEVRAGSATGALLESTDYTYARETLAVGDTFAAYGIAPPNLRYPVHTTETVITRGNDIFTTRQFFHDDQLVSNYSFGAPHQIETLSNRSSLIRTTDIVYEHNKTKWVLRLPKTITRNGKVFGHATYDTLGRITQLDRFGSSDMTYSYHGAGTQGGALAWVEDALSRRTSFDNFKRGRPQLITRADNSTLSRVVDNNGWVTSETNARNVTTAYQYNSMGWLTTVDRVAPWSDTTIAYTGLGAGLTQTSTRGNARTTNTYDGFLRPTLVKTEALSGGGLTSYVKTDYDFLGREIFTSFPSASSNPTAGVDTTYDALGRMTQTSETVAPFATTTYLYQNQNRTRVTDPRGFVTTTTKRAYGTPDNGDIIRISQPENVITDMTYDDWGNMLTARQFKTGGGGADQTQRYVYDSRLRLCRHSVPETGDTFYDYDVADQMTGVARGQAAGTVCPTSMPSGDTVIRTYDLLGQVDIVNYPGTTPDIDFDYDANGNVTRNARGGAVWDYIYDTADNLTEEKLGIDGRLYTTTYLYSNDNHLLSQTTPAGRIVSFAPNGLGQTTRAQVSGYNYASAISYHPNGSVAGLTYGNGHVMARGLNARQLVDSLMVSKTGVTAVDLDYTYYADGRIHEKIDRATPVTAGAARTVEAEYDANNRLWRARDTAAGGAWQTYAYDARGNVTGNGALTFTYDAAEQPTSMSGAASGSFVYDGNLKRVKQTIDGEVIYSVYSQTGAILYRDNATTSEATDYIRAAGQTMARIRGSVTTFPHQDHLGSPIVETGLTGAVNWREAYSAYGEKRLDPVGNRDNEGFTGHIDDAASGLTYMQARYYDPVIGRFLSNDPVAFSVDQPQMFNRYSYTLNDPVNMVDPDGECSVTSSSGQAQCRDLLENFESKRETFDQVGDIVGDGNDQLGQAVVTVGSLGVGGGTLAAGTKVTQTLAANGAPKLGKVVGELLNSASDIAISAAIDGVANNGSSMTSNPNAPTVGEITNRDPLAGTQAGTVQLEPLSTDPNAVPADARVNERSPRTLGGKIREGMRRAAEVLDELVD